MTSTTRHIDTISLRDVYPRVFAGDDYRPVLERSGVWLADLTFKRGNRYLVSAESGTGKSSMCSFIYGNRRDYNGTIAFDSEDVRSFSIDRWCDIRRHNISLLPQEMRLFPELTVIENLRIKNRLTDRLTEAEMVAMLQRLEIDNKVNELAGHLSVGQQQRVALIRALCQPFDFIILDEPVSHLDRRNNMIVAQLVTEHADANGAAVIATSVGNNLLLDNAINISL